MTMPAAFYDATDAVVSDAPLVIRRVVRWGECDPAGIVYTPRFLDYCVTAYEAFLGQMLGGPLHATKHSMGVDFPVRGAELDFRSPLPLDAAFTMEVRVGAIRSRTFDLHITARHVVEEGKREGRTAFLARLTPVLVDPETRAAVALPEKLKERVEEYAARHPYQEKQP